MAVRRALVASFILSLAVVLPTAAAKPERTVIDVSSPEYEGGVEAFLAGVCGYAIDLEAEGHIIIQVFDRERGKAQVVELNHYRLSETFTANGKTVVVHVDAGPDVYRMTRDGRLIVAITGRSITGSGVIGRTVIDVDTGELLFQAGNEVGDFLARLCEELAPPAP